MSEVQSKSKFRMILTNARLAFPSIWRPYEGDGDSNKFNLKALIPKNHPQLAELEKLMKAASVDEWGVKADATLKALKAADKTCLHNGDAKTEWEGFEGNLYVSASSRTQPSILDADKSDLTEADGTIYSGCMVDVAIEVWAQDNKYGKRLNATLRGVRFRADNDRFTGGGSPPADADEFDDISAPAEGGDDDLTA